MFQKHQVGNWKFWSLLSQYSTTWPWKFYWTCVFPDGWKIIAETTLEMQMPKNHNTSTKKDQDVHVAFPVCSRDPFKNPWNNNLSNVLLKLTVLHAIRPTFQHGLDRSRMSCGLKKKSFETTWASQALSNPPKKDPPSKNISLVSEKPRPPQP